MYITLHIALKKKTIMHFTKKLLKNVDVFVQPKYRVEIKKKTNKNRYIKKEYSNKYKKYIFCTAEMAQFGTNDCT